MKDYPAKGDQAILFHVDTWDADCPQHIPQRVDAGEMAMRLAAGELRIVELVQELARLRG